MPSRGSQVEVDFSSPFFPPSLYRNDKWSGGLKFKNWAHELSDLSNFLYTWNDFTTRHKISTFFK